MNTPKIRFKGFEDDWEQRKLGDIAGNVYGGGTPKTNVDEYWNGDIPWIQSSNVQEDQLFNVEISKKITNTGLEKSAAKLIPANSIAVVTHVGVGKLVYMPFSYATSQDFISLSDLKTDEKFMCYSLYQRLQKDIYIVQGSAIKGITKEDLLTKQIMIPCKAEQEKIGNYFQSLDHLITLHQRKCDETKQLKKFMLQKMFPKNGEKNPEIRFEGFTDDWEQRKLGEMVSLRGRIGFRGYTQNDLVGEGDGAITFSPADIDNDGNVSLEGNKYLTWEKYEESPEIKVQIGDILFTKTASIGKVGYVRELKEKATINPQFALLTPNEKANGYFTFLSVRNNVFMKQVRSITGGSSVPTMSQEKLKELTFMTPSLEEQKKIGEYFEKLDYLITLHQRKCEKLKELKKYMLQNMFV